MSALIHHPSPFAIQKHFLIYSSLINSIVWAHSFHFLKVFLNNLILIDMITFMATTVNAVESLLPTPIANCSLTAVGNKVFVFGGTDVKGACYNDIRSLDVGDYLKPSDITVGEGASSDYSFKILIIGDACKKLNHLYSHCISTLFLKSMQISYPSSLFLLSSLLFFIASSSWMVILLHHIYRPTD